MSKKFALSAVALLPLFAGQVMAEEEVQDMSDPLAVFTSVGAGATDKGLNLKVTRSYDTGSDTTMGMNIVEVKGFMGESLGWRSANERDNSIDSLRYRNFEVDLTNGRGTQIDVSFGLDNAPMGDGNLFDQAGTASYSFIQALPKIGNLQLYPLAGAGVAIADDWADNGDVNNVDSGYSIPGTFAMAGMYTKYEITDKMWFNYNPMYFSTLSGDEFYKDHFFEGDSNVLLHEVALSYQFTPRFNVRYFANWSENSNYADGNHRVEFNYQF